MESRKKNKNYMESRKKNKNYKNNNVVNNKNKEKNKDIVYLDGKIKIKNKEYSLSNNSDIDDLVKNLTNAEDKKKIESIVNAYSSKIIKEYNLIVYGIEDENKKKIEYINEADFSNFSIDSFDKLKNINSMIEYSCKSAKIEEKKDAIKKGILKLQKNKNKKICDLDKRERGYFDDFFEVFRTISNNSNILKDFSYKAGLNNLTDLDNIKNEFYKSYKAEEGAEMINEFVNQHKHFLSNEKDLYIENDRIINDTITSLQDKSNKINDLSDKISKGINDEIDKVDQLTSIVEKHREMDKKNHPILYFASRLLTLGFFSYTSKETDDLAKALEQMSTKILKDQMLISSELSESRDSLIKKQLATINGSTLNMEKKLSLDGMEINVCSTENVKGGVSYGRIDFKNDSKRVLKDNKKIKESMIKIGKIKETKNEDSISSGVNNKDMIIKGNGIII